MTPEELRAARAAFGLTGAEFAQVFDVSDRTVRGWEAGHRDGNPAPGSAPDRRPGAPCPQTCLSAARARDFVRREDSQDNRRGRRRTLEEPGVFVATALRPSPNQASTVS